MDLAVVGRARRRAASRVFQGRAGSSLRSNMPGQHGGAPRPRRPGRARSRRGRRSARRRADVGARLAEVAGEGLRAAPPGRCRRATRSARRARLASGSSPEASWTRATAQRRSRPQGASRAGRPASMATAACARPGPADLRAWRTADGSRAVVLAGGTAARLGGVDKAGVEHAGRTLLEPWPLDGVPRRRRGRGRRRRRCAPTGPVTFVREDPPHGGPSAALLTGVDALLHRPPLVAGARRRHAAA